MTKSLEGKKAIVTGSGRGIGKAIAAKLAEEGAAVGLVSRSRDQLESAAREIRDAGGEVSIFPGDVSREDDHEEFVRLAGEFAKELQRSRRLARARWPPDDRV